MISPLSSSDSSLLLLTFLVTFVAVLFLSILVGVFSRSGYISKKRRREVFCKLSKEYGLVMDTPKYPWNSTIVPLKPYTLQRLVGTVHGHTVCIEDVRYFHVKNGTTLFLVLFFSELSRPGLIAVYQTEITVDGLKHIVDNGGLISPVYDKRAYYKNIKVVLDQIA